MQIWTSPHVEISAVGQRLCALAYVPMRM